jgi:hypothetical protein
MRAHARELRAFVDEHDRRAHRRRSITTERRFKELQQAKAEVGRARRAARPPS